MQKRVSKKKDNNITDQAGKKCEKYEMLLPS